jgi:hypothetical protein
MRSDHFIDPPTGIFVRSVDDSVTLASHESLLKLPEKTPIRFLKMGCAGIGVLFCLAVLVTIWLFDAPFKMNGQELPKTVGTLIIVGFMTVWVTMVLFILGRMERMVLMFLGKIPQIGWRLRLQDDLWVADRLLGLGMKTHTLASQDVSAVETDDSGCLVVKAEGKDIPITTPLQPDVAEWMKDRLSKLV